MARYTHRNVDMRITILADDNILEVEGEEFARTNRFNLELLFAKAHHLLWSDYASKDYSFTKEHCFREMTEIARKVGLQEYVSDLLIHDQLWRVDRGKDEGRSLAYCRDGSRQ